MCTAHRECDDLACPRRRPRAMVFEPVTDESVALAVRLSKLNDAAARRKILFGRAGGAVWAGWLLWAGAIGFMIGRAT